MAKNETDGRKRASCGGDNSRRAGNKKKSGEAFQKRSVCAAEIALEHHLGLTCDPVRGLVQIPCTERNAVAAMRAVDAVSLAEMLYEDRKISLDLVVKTMYETGKDLSCRYRETSEGSLASLYGSDL